jgi:hypothetical protein
LAPVLSYSPQCKATDIEGVIVESKSTQSDTQQNPFAFSRKISGIAALMWLVSLLLPGFVFYSQSNAYLGISILLMGWIGILATYVGWYANIFWVFVVIKLRSSRASALTPSVVAVLLSLDTFRFEDASMGGPPQYVYGIGIGGILWLTAIFLTMLAAAIREIEKTHDDLPQFILSHGSLQERIRALFAVSRNTGQIWLLNSSMALLVGFVGTVLVLSVYDRVVGNADERVKLNQSLGAFKRSEVCSVSLKPANKILIDGPLELINPKNHKVITREALLAMGVPVVREIDDWQLWEGEMIRSEEPQHRCRMVDSKLWSNNINSNAQDYYLEDSRNPKSSRRIEPKTPGVARLTIEYFFTQENGQGPAGAQYHIKLVSKQGIVGFDQVFRADKYLNVYCPNLMNYGGPHNSLEKLVSETLIFPKQANADQ